MRTIVFIETNKSGSSREAIKAAERLGFYTVLFTEREQTLKQRTEYPDVHEMIFHNLRDIDGLRSSIKFLEVQGKQVQTIVSFVDSYVYTAALLSEEFCNGRVPSDTVLTMEDKSKTRLALVNETVTPYFTIFNPQEDLNEFIQQQVKRLPLIIKSPTSTGSKDVFLATTNTQLKKHISYLQKKYPDEPILIEEFMDGEQYLIEALMVNGEINIAAIIEQEITKKERFIVTGYCVLADVPEQLYQEIHHVLSSIRDKLNFQHGALHLEIKRGKDGNLKIVEVNPRISGGAMNNMIKAAFGFNLVEETLKMMVGQQPSLQKKYAYYSFTQYITVSSSGVVTKVTGKNKALKRPGIVEVYIKTRKGNTVFPPLSMGNRYAYVIAADKKKEKAIQFAKDAAKEIEFHLSSF